MAKQHKFNEKQEQYIAKEVRRRLEIHRKKDKANQNVTEMPFYLRMKYETSKVVKHATWLVDNAGVGWAMVGVGADQFIALMFNASQWELVDGELRRKTPTVSETSRVEVVSVE